MAIERPLAWLAALLAELRLPYAVIGAHAVNAWLELRRGVVGAEGLRVATVPDLIVLKLIANRPKDQLDLLGLLALPSVDWVYVERWASEWDVQGLLEELRARVRG